MGDETQRCRRCGREGGVETCSEPTLRFCNICVLCWYEDDDCYWLFNGSRWEAHGLVAIGFGESAEEALQNLENLEE